MTAVKHTAYPESFGLLYGKTTKTACDIRVPTEKLVPQMEATCPGCQDRIIEWLAGLSDMYQSMRDLIHEASEAFLATHPEYAGLHTPEELINLRLITPREFWELVHRTQA